MLGWNSEGHEYFICVFVVKKKKKEKNNLPLYQSALVRKGRYFSPCM